MGTAATARQLILQLCSAGQPIPPVWSYNWQLDALWRMFTNYTCYGFDTTDAFWILLPGTTKSTALRPVFSLKEKCEDNMENHDVVGWTSEKPWFSSRQEQMILSAPFIPAMGQIRPPIQWESKIFPWGKAAGCLSQPLTFFKCWCSQRVDLHLYSPLYLYK